MKTVTELANIDVLEHALFIEFHPHESVFLSDAPKMLEFWEALTPLAKQGKNTMIFKSPRDFLAPSRTDLYWERVRKSTTPHLPESAKNGLARSLRFIRASNIVTVAILEGEVDFDLLGLPLACTYRLCTSDTSFVNATMRRGVPPAGAAPWFLSSILGANQMKKFYLENSVLSAEGALGWGIVDAVYGAEQVDDEARTLAKRFASFESSAIRSLFMVADETDLDLSSYLKKHGAGF